MTSTLALDVYGTLIDPLGISTMLETYVGDKAPQFARIWRDKQIEYLYRRALMRDYRDFPTCTRQALEFTDQLLETNLPKRACDALRRHTASSLPTRMYRRHSNGSELTIDACMRSRTDTRAISKPCWHTLGWIGTSTES